VRPQTTDPAPRAALAASRPRVCPRLTRCFVLSPAGSFKERGARNALLQLDERQKDKGVIAASAGNHALALSYHGARPTREDNDDLQYSRKCMACLVQTEQRSEGGQGHRAAGRSELRDGPMRRDKLGPASCVAGGQLGIPVTVIMPVNAPLIKVEKCRKLGAKVVRVPTPPGARAAAPGPRRF
jgi:hypothetical protein